MQISENKRDVIISRGIEPSGNHSNGTTLLVSIGHLQRIKPVVEIAEINRY